MSSAPLGAAAGRRPGLTREDVVRVAIALTAREGLDAVTLRAVALELGVRPPSLYHHLPGGLDELREQVVDTLVADIEGELDAEPLTGLTLWDAVSRPLVRIGRLAQEYPGVMQHMLVTARDQGALLRGADRFVAMVLASELADRAPTALVLFHTYVNGWVHAQRPTAAAARRAGLEDLARVLEAADELDAEEVLLSGLRALMEGLLEADRQA